MIARCIPDGRTNPKSGPTPGMKGRTTVTIAAMDVSQTSVPDAPFALKIDFRLRIEKRRISSVRILPMNQFV